jgi:pyruvate dehydrogenase E2 component (dihydrolipoamide acetyltransferase)
MAFEVTLPRLGWDMEEGSLAGWLKKDGEFVNAGELLFAVEGDKAVQEIEALDSGYLRILPDGPQPGQKVPVGTLLAFLIPEEERQTFLLPGRGPAAGPPAQPEPAPEAQIPAPASSGSGDGKHRIYISPYARRLAQGLGIDWRTIQGSGMAGRIMARDVQEAAAAMHAAVAAKASEKASIPAPALAPQPAAASGITRAPMTPIRKKIAEHMAYSAHNTAPVTLTTEVDATELVALRNALKNDATAQAQPVPTYNDLLAKISAQALLEHPLLNARIEGDEIVQSGAVHVGIAVDSERGLIVPVVRDVQAKTLRQIARESAALIEKTRIGTISYEDLQGATFTITNLGMYEIDAFTPIIDLPQCAILGVGRIAPKQVVVDAASERVAIRQRMFLSLTFDHRLVDGAQAARFLQRIKRFIEMPYLWLAG